MTEILLKERGLSLDRLQTFFKVAAAKGVMKAAGGDPVTQSLFSRQIKELESFFGAPLINRSGGGIELTAQGAELYEYTSQIFNTLAEFKAKCRNGKKRFTIYSSNTFFDYFMMPCINRLHKKHPSWEYTLMPHRTANIIKSIIAQRADIGIVRDINIPAELKKSPLLPLKYAIHIPRALTTKVKKIDDLSNYPFALTHEGYIRERIDALNSELNLGIRIVISCRSSTQAREALETGHYASILPIVGAKVLDPKKYHQLTPTWLSQLNAQLAIIWSPRLLRLKPEIRSIVDDLKEILKEKL